MRVVNDRRGAKRVIVRGEACLQTPRGPLRCRCVDISEGGMSVVSPEPARPRQRARIETRFGGQNLAFEAVVVRRQRSRDGHVLGLRFERLDPFTRAQLDTLLRSMQVQAALAQQASAFVDRLPRLELPGPDPTTKTLVAEHVERPPPTPVIDPVEWLGAHARPTPTMPWSARAQPSATTSPRAPVAPVAPRRPEPAPPAAPKATSRFTHTGEPRWDETMLAPGPPVARPFGLDEGWSEDELETRHYQPKASSSRTSAPTLPSDLPEVPRLSSDLQAALDRVRRRDASTKTQPHPVVPPPAVLADLDLGDGT